MTTPLDEASLQQLIDEGHAEQLLAMVEWQLAEKSLKEYIKQAWHILEPGRKFQDNWHIDAVCEHLEAVTKRQIKRLIINIPFRCMKSILTCVAWPTWQWGPYNDPKHQWLFTSHSERLAIRDSQKCRRLIESPWYQMRWGNRVKFSKDQNQKHKFENIANGHRVSYGLLANITGDGGDTIVVDDPHDRDQAMSEKERQNALEAFDEKLVTRLNDPATGAIVIIMQRLHENDLSGHLLEDVGGYEHLCIPMEFEPERKCFTSLGWEDPREKPGELMWPKRFPPMILEQLKKSLGAYGAAGQLQQRPSPEEGGILKRSYWQPWTRKDPPELLYVLQSYDTAFSEDQQADYSARTTWGVFLHPRCDDPEDPFYAILLLEAWRGKVEYSDLRSLAQAAAVKWEPNLVLVEYKGSGIALVQDMNRAGIPTKAFKPGKGLDKMVRAKQTEAYLQSGVVYYPEGMHWAQQVIDECAAFPNGKNDDFVDSCTQAWLQLRDMWWLIHPLDPKDDPIERLSRSQPITYYG